MQPELNIPVRLIERARTTFHYMLHLIKLSANHIVCVRWDAMRVDAFKGCQMHRPTSSLV